MKHGRSAVVDLLDPAGAANNVSPSKADAAPADPAQIKAAAEKSLTLLQSCGPTFFTRSGCVACHQQSVTSMALGEARKHALKIDEKIAREQVHVTVMFGKTYIERFLQRSDQPLSSPPSVGYLSLGLAAENYSGDETTDALVVEMAGRQQTDGSWMAFSHRPPLEYSRLAATALAIRAMQLYGPPGLKGQFDERISRGRQWLLATEATTLHDQAFRLLGLTWVGADKQLIESQTATLLRSQRPDGGWSQYPAMESDAFATGLALYALRLGGELSPSNAAYQRGVAYLLQTQLPDGSWHVKTRSFPFQEYFESGFPHGHDQWISATATGFATVALMQALPPTAKGAE
jgi:hypothetical protein